MKITSGRVMYSRTVQVKQFEPKQIQAELVFTLEDNEKIDAAFEDAVAIAEEQVLAALKLRTRD